MHLVKEIYGIAKLAFESATILLFVLRPLTTVVADKPRPEERRHCMSAQ